MKTPPILMFAVLCMANYVTAQDNVSRKVLLSIQPGETIVINESCIEVSMSANQLYLVTTLDKKVYVYEKGLRTGPFDSFKDLTIRNCGEHNSSECAVYEQPRQTNIEEYVKITDEGAYSIQFKGKTFGSYTYVANLIITPDQSKFAAIVADAAMKFSLVTSEGVQQVLAGNLENIQVSPSGSQYLVIVKENNFDPSLLTTDFSKMSQEEIMKMMQEIAEKQANDPEPQTQIIGTGGKLIGRYKSSEIYSNNPAYCQTGGDNWYMVIDNTLYVNGQLIKQFDSEVSASTCKVWLSKDGKRFALVGYDKILFSDGKSYPPAIHLQLDNSGTKIILKWIALENEKDLVSYSKEL